MAVKKQAAPKRVYRDDMMIDSDTLKLEIANYARNVSFDEKKPLLIATEHCHFFHTFDSNGRAQVECNSVGGHKHKVVVEMDDQGNIVGKCGPAIWSKPTSHDNHTHEVKYIKSDRFKVRSYSKEAQAVIAKMG